MICPMSEQAGTVTYVNICSFMPACRHSYVRFESSQIYPVLHFKNNKPFMLATEYCIQYDSPGPQET